MAKSGRNGLPGPKIDLIDIWLKSYIFGTVKRWKEAGKILPIQTHFPNFIDFDRYRSERIIFSKGGGVNKKNENKLLTAKNGCNGPLDPQTDLADIPLHSSHASQVDRP